MGTTIRPEVSEKNKYWIEKHRYYELKHFCLQYPVWKKAHIALDGWGDKHSSVIEQFKASGISNPTEKCAEARLFYSERIELIERVAQETNPELSSYIIKSVTTGISFDHLKARLEIPCCRDVYYEMYRRFFWLLNKERQ